MSHWLYELASKVLSAKPAAAQREWLSARLARIDAIPLQPSIHDSNGERPEDAVAAALDPAMKAEHPEIYDIALDIVGAAIEALYRHVSQILRRASTVDALDGEIETGLIALRVANAAKCEDLRAQLLSVAQLAKNADGEIRRVFVAATRGLSAMSNSTDDLAFWLDATKVREVEVLAFRVLAAIAPRDELTVRALSDFRARATGDENAVRRASVDGYFEGVGEAAAAAAMTYEVSAALSNDEHATTGVSVAQQPLLLDTSPNLAVLRSILEEFHASQRSETPRSKGASRVHLWLYNSLLKSTAEVSLGSANIRGDWPRLWKVYDRSSNIGVKMYGSAEFAKRKHSGQNFDGYQTKESLLSA